MILLSVLAAHQSVEILNIEKFKDNTPLQTTKALPNTTSIFLRNEYEQGATILKIDGVQGRFLGADPTLSTLAVNTTVTDSATGQQQSKLKIFDTQSQSVRHETAGSKCSNVSQNNFIYCQNEQRTHITAIHILTGKRMFAFPSPNPEADLLLIGSRQQADVLLARTPATSAAATNVVYSISGNQLRWSQQLHPQETCHVINQQKTIACLQPAAGTPDATQLRTLQVSTGNELAQYHSDHKLIPTSTGWMEQLGTGPQTKYAFFTVHGAKLGEYHSSGPQAFFPYNTDYKLSNTISLIYPGQSIANFDPPNAGIVAADGSVQYRLIAETHQHRSYATLDNSKPVFKFPAEAMLTASHNGKLLLVQQPANEHTQHFQVVNAATGKVTVEATGTTAAVINGILAIAQVPQQPNETSSLAIMLPKPPQ